MLTELPEKAKEVLKKEKITELRPAQEKAIKAGLFKGKNLLICTPTASGKTLIAEMAAAKNILEGKGKTIYIVPLVALATEKYKEFKRKYEHLFKIALSIGDYDRSETQLIDADLIICTAEKLDSLIRHHSPWLKFVSLVVVDEIHLMNDVSRGPTLEIIITVLKKVLPNIQIIGLSATIGNPGELAEWLNAELVLDTWRPVPLKKGVYLQGEVEFEEKKKN
ncbi:DEAD/DEAH box helicase [Candidatus Woesearchaeota archaeon]|nr:DEAD/DEAH box helicase [Candidatus Woesearchaeota archaeon]MBW2994305.1 DEAD/DEAH box helicase [Candidatus Woesearchaeota archaeon]